MGSGFETCIKYAQNIAMPITDRGIGGGEPPLLRHAVWRNSDRLVFEEDRLTRHSSFYCRAEFSPNLGTSICE